MAVNEESFTAGYSVNNMSIEQFRADWRPIRGHCVYKVSISGSLGTMGEVPIMFQLKGDYCLNVLLIGEE